MKKIIYILLGLIIIVIVAIIILFDPIGKKLLNSMLLNY